MARRVIFDTNSLMIPGREGVDIFAEVERALSSLPSFKVMEGSLRELEFIAKSGTGKDRAAVKLVLAILKGKDIGVIPQESESVDNAIVETVVPGDVVVTMDKNLRKRLKEKGVDTAVLRQRKYILILEA